MRYKTAIIGMFTAVLVAMAAIAVWSCRRDNRLYVMNQANERI